MVPCERLHVNDQQELVAHHRPEGHLQHRKHGGTSGSLLQFPETADIETSSEAYARRFAGDIGAWFLKIQEETTLRMLAPYPHAKVLDVGGGHGQLTHALVRNGFNVTVVGSAEVCKQRIENLVANRRCTFEIANFLDLPYPNQAFDIVVSFRLLPHVAEWRRFLAELARVARKAIIIDYPAARSLNYFAPALFRYKLRAEGNTRPFTCFKEPDLLNVMNGLGFTKADRFAEFCMPMVVHRILKMRRLSSGVEHVLRMLGLTKLFGSPVILKLVPGGTIK
jgi:SAM-dependent methyltransferase